MKKMLEKLKNNKSSMALIILALVLIIAGISFALSSPSINLLGRRNIKISKCELDLNFKESDELMLVSKYPIKDSEALKYKAKDVVITNNSTCDTAYYKLTIKDLNNSSINKNKIKFQLIDNTSGNTTNGSNPDTFLVEDSLNKKESKSYSIRLWIDESASNSDIYINGDATKPKEYKFALNLESSDGSLAPNIDSSGANAPELTSNMIPVYYDSTSDSWKKADSNNKDNNYKWYDYDNKMWANAVTVTNTNRQTYLKADAGTTIPMSDINTMWVWVPRYTYTYLNTNTPQEIKIKFENGTASTGTIKCTDAVTGTSSTSETCTDTTNGGLKAGTSTYTHPAFWWDKNDNNVREESEELTGIWVGKFEVSSDTTCTVSVLDNVAVGEGCNLQSIRPQIKPNVTSWRGAQLGTFFNGIQKMRETGNQYGFSTRDETHMMKNMEWGAVTYLSHSKYGINKEIAKNSANTMTTGCGPQSETSTSYGATCNSYTTTLGQSASTTGNVYGIYDMSGASWEYLMGNMVYSNGQQMSGYSTSSNQNSAFTGILDDDGKDTSFTGTYAFPSKRYYDKYSYGTSNAEYTKGKLGDATKEMAPASGRSWYSDYAVSVHSYFPWIPRGGYFGSDADAGAFSFSNSIGSAGYYCSTRAVISNLN